MFNLVEDLNTRPLSARLAKNILMLGESYGIHQGDEVRIGLQLAQEDLAQLVGASRQRVNQELKGFEREGALRIEPTRIVVLSREKLVTPPNAKVASDTCRCRRAHADIETSPMNQTEQNTGTRPVADSHRFDIAALEPFLAAHLPGFAGPLSVEQFKGGQSNPTYKLVTPSRAVRDALEARARSPSCCRRRTRSNASTA